MTLRMLPVIAALALSGVACPLPALAQATMSGEKTVEVGGAPMYPSKTIVENAVNSKDHTTLVAAVKAAGLVDTLSGPGPFTVFAPTNKAFEALPKGMCGRPLRCKKNLWTAAALDRVLPCVRPLLRRLTGRGPVWEFVDQVHITEARSKRSPFAWFS